jgi:hypothetical protein
LVTFNGLTLCVSEWAERLGLSDSLMHYRLAHWPLSRVFEGVNHLPLPIPAAND